jgi:hypothetical protein
LDTSGSSTRLCYPSSEPNHWARELNLVQIVLGCACVAASKGALSRAPGFESCIRGTHGSSAKPPRAKLAGNFKNQGHATRPAGAVRTRPAGDGRKKGRRQRTTTAPKGHTPPELAVVVQ